jgi:D-tyrosyl-tRNA(Tyr) deacylase
MVILVPWDFPRYCETGLTLVLVGTKLHGRAQTMRAVVQRVTTASVIVEGQEVGRIGKGLLALVGVALTDTEASGLSLTDKILSLRIFEDEAQKMNRSLLDIGGQLLLVSQFTLFGDVRRGNRPSFTQAMEPVMAERLFEQVCQRARDRGVTVATGRFRTDMKVMLVNDGPVTILIDSEKAF